MLLGSGLQQRRRLQSLTTDQNVENEGQWGWALGHQVWQQALCPTPADMPAS